MNTTTDYKGEVDHSEITPGDVVTDIPQHASRWHYLAATGLILSWVAEVQLFSQSGILLSIIDTDLGAKKQYPWVFESFLFVATILSTPAGAIADRLGRKWFIIGGNLVSIVGGIVCATARSVNVVIVGMAVAGVGTTGQHFAIAAISELFPRKVRGLAQGTLQLAVFPFTACGVITGAAMAVYSTWRWTYYIYIILSGLALVTTFLFYDPPLPEKETSTQEYLKTVDWVECILILLSITGFGVGGGFAIFGIYPWTNAGVLVPIFGGFGIFALFSLRVRSYTGPNPLFPKYIFNNEFLFLILIAGCISMSVYTAIFTWISQIQAIYTQDLIQVGKFNFPAGFGTEVGVVISGLAMRKLGRTNWQLTTACFFLTLFVALLATLTPNSIRPGLAYLSIAGVANGFIQVLIPAMIQLTNADQHIGAVTGLLILVRYLGGAAGILMSLTIIRSRVGFTWAPNVAKVTLPLGLPESSLPLLLQALETANPAVLIQVPSVTLQIIEAATMATKETYANAYRITYYPIMALGIVATLVAFFFSPDVTSRMDNSLAFQHRRPWFLRRKLQKSG